jgi:hypothetical protein
MMMRCAHSHGRNRTLQAQKEIKSEVGIAQVRAKAINQDKTAAPAKQAYYGGTCRVRIIMRF